MARPDLEIADTFRDHGAAWRDANRGHVSLAQMKVMSAIERCRTAALGGHIVRCENGACGHTLIAYNSYTLPAPIADLAFTNKAVVYDILFKASAAATTTIAAGKRRLGARIGITSVLHTWGSAITHHPQVHMIVPGGGLSDCGTRWVACRPEFFLPVRVLSRLFRRPVIEMLTAAHAAGKLAFFGPHAALTNDQAFAAFLAPLKRRVARRSRIFCARGPH